MSTKSTDIVLAVVHVFFCPERHDNIIGYVCVTISEYFSLYKGGLSLILCYSMIVTSISIGPTVETNIIVFEYHKSYSIDG